MAKRDEAYGADGRSGSGVAAARAAAQGLGGDAAGTVLDAVRRSAGLQAQDGTAVRLAVRARTRGLGTADVDRAYLDRSVVRTWLMRGTLHLVPASDVGWLTRLYGPGLIAADRRRRAQLGLDRETCERALPAIRTALADGPLSRADLVGRLVRAGVAVTSSGQAPAHLMLYAAASGVVCRGPDRADGEPLHVVTEDWVGTAVHDGPDGEDAVRELARRYVGAYGPATVEDLAAWAGLAAGRCRAALGALVAAGAVVEAGSGRYADPAAADPPVAGAGVVRLVPAFDTYLLGYRDRDLILDPAHAKRIVAGGGWLHPGVVVDGRYAGSWRLHRPRSGGEAAVVVDPFPGPDPVPERALAAEVADVGRFLGVEARLETGPAPAR